ncbi:hypothetical protein EDD85DRAFT_982598 [Armillaria nabsnona]|nr:hypothetical protein EDD85DRAFT_982598 [Armillaria nabsnona]
MPISIQSPSWLLPGGSPIDRLQEPSPSPYTLAAVPSSTSSYKVGHPSLGDVFSPIGGASSPISPISQKENALTSSFVSPTAPNNSNIFDVSQDIQLLNFAPSGLNFLTDEPLFPKGSDAPKVDVARGGFQRKALTPTPFTNKGKGKEETVEVKEEKESIAPAEVDEALFHAREKSHRLPAPLHERS